MDLFTADELRSREALRFAFVLEQGYDDSCGYSAAASLLSLYWGMPVGERELLERYAAERLASGELGVDLAQLAAILEDYGFSVKGARMGWDQLCAALERFEPVLVHYDRPDGHFALALRARDGWIITLDPALGCELQSRERFSERWSGAVLLAWSDGARRDDGLVSAARELALGRRELCERRAK